MNKLIVDQSTEKRIKKGVQLLSARDFPNLTVSDGLAELRNTSDQFLGTAYLSLQNKGIGWVLSRQAITFDQDFLLPLFTRAREGRRAYEADAQTTAYRLFNQDGDGLGGLTIDRYGDFALFSWYNNFIYQERGQIIQAFQMVFPDLAGAYEKIRFKGPDYESAHLYGQEAPETFPILENGVTYQVFLNDGLMTGIFLDQHEVRGALVDGLAAGKTLLNLFSYTAAFSVAAAMGGAIETTSVDLAKRSRELSEAHFKANHLAVDDHRFIVMDVFDYFKYAQRHGLTYDVIVIDPPSFARNKKQTFSVVKDYHKLIVQAREILNPGGILIASTNASNLTLTQFKKQITKGFGGQEPRIISSQQLPGDFATNKNDESSNYLKVVTIKV